MVGDVLTQCTLLHSACDLRTTQINVQCSPIWEFMLYKFKMSHDTAETTKDICSVKGENAINHRVNQMAWEILPKTMNAEALLQAIEGNYLVRSTQRIRMKLSISVGSSPSQSQQKHPNPPNYTPNKWTPVQWRFANNLGKPICSVFQKIKNVMKRRYFCTILICIGIG